MATPIEELNKLVEQFSPDRQKRVLEFAQELAKADRQAPFFPTTPLPPGTPGRALLRFKLPPEDVDAMELALEDCERIEPDEY